MQKTTSKQEEETTKNSVQTLADNGYLKDGVLYRNDMRVGEDQLTSKERQSETERRKSEECN